MSHFKRKFTQEKKSIKHKNIAMDFTSIFNGYPDLTPFMPLELKTLCVISFILNIFVN